MRSIYAVILSALALASLTGVSRGESEAAAKLGQKIGNLSFTQPDGKTFSLHDLKDREAVVVVFLSFECPNSTGYAPVLAEMAKKYGGRKVAFLGIGCGEDEAPTLAKHAEEFKLGFPVYKDERGAAVETLKAEITPEAFVLDHNFVLRYRGRIDDGYTARLKKNLQIKHHDLQRRARGGAGRQEREPAAHGGHRLPNRRGKERQEGRPRDLLPRRGPHRPEPLSGMPSAGPGRPLLADDLQASRELVARHQGLYRLSPDAAVEDHQRSGVPQRPPAHRQGNRHAGRLGRRGHPGGQP